MVRLKHIFAAGIRFDTEIEYLAQTDRRFRYHKLPVLKSGSAQVYAFTSVLQCVLILGFMPHKSVTPQRKRVAQRALGQTVQPGDSSILHCLRVLNDPGGENPLQSANTPNPAEMGETALAVLRSGGLCLLKYESAIARRWVTVIGLEVKIHHGNTLPRALLLLDSQTGEPWACAHNVRIELKPPGTRPGGARSAYPLICRHLTGEASKVRLLNLITLKAAVAEPPNRGSAQR